MTELLYQTDSYLKEFDARVLEINSELNALVLDRTAFYPGGGGQPNDTGTIQFADKFVSVIKVKAHAGKILHWIEGDLPAPDTLIKGKIDWDRRYKLMRYHTATHVLCGIFSREYELLVTGNQLTTEKGRVDLNMEKMDVDVLKQAFVKANEIIQKDLPIEIYYKSREEAEKDPSLFKLAIDFPHDIKTLRIVDIKGFDAQADGGCHVNSLKEIGKLVFKEAVNKGKHNRRVYFTVE